MNILVFNEAAWDDKNSFGNTVSNLFCGETWAKDYFFDFYVRNQIPENQIRAVYYNLSAVDIIKGIGRLHINGRKFSSEEILVEKKSSDITFDKEQRIIDRLHHSHNEIVYYIHELIWRSRIWLNRSFKCFVREASPDILFAFTTSPFILWPLIQWLQCNTKCKIVLFAVDDVYGGIAKYAFYRRHYWKKGFEKSYYAANKVYAISDEMKELYEKRFGKKVTTLYKGCDLSFPVKQKLNSPLRFIYAGNLLWGRDDTLEQIAHALERENRTGVKATMEIYTGTTITSELKQKLNCGVSSRIMGPRPYDEIKKILNDADVVLHVESFEIKSIETVRYSFSTKIIDCLQSGSQVLGIGPEEIASIRYLKKINGVITADSPEQIGETVAELIRHKDSILQNARSTRTFAMCNHEIGMTQRQLREDFKRLVMQSDNNP